MESSFGMLRYKVSLWSVAPLGVQQVKGLHDLLLLRYDLTNSVESRSARIFSHPEISKSKMVVLLPRDLGLEIIWQRHVLPKFGKRLDIGRPYDMPPKQFQLHSNFRDE